MQPGFWEKKWRKGQTGFHSDEPNPRLVQLWHRLSIPRQCPVLVPLCGKTYDMIWLRERGHPVTGIELSAIACESFFRENGIEYESEKTGEFVQFRGEGITLWQGNFFHFSISGDRPFPAVYDRAALIALPPDMRISYRNKLLECVNDNCNIFLHTLEYDPAEMSGPPFPVFEEEVRNLYNDFNYECLAAADVISKYPDFMKRGLTALSERVAVLRRHGD